LSWWQRAAAAAGGWMTGRHTSRQVATRHQSLVAMAAANAPPHGADLHRLTLLVHPDHRGQVEEALISRALAGLDGAKAGAIRTTVDQDDETSLRGLRARGFVEERTLLTLQRKPA
jgi:hypothetical protein